MKKRKNCKCFNKGYKFHFPKATTHVLLINEGQLGSIGRKREETFLILARKFRLNKTLHVRAVVSR